MVLIRVQGRCGFFMFGKEKKANKDQYSMLIEFLLVNVLIQNSCDSLIFSFPKETLLWILTSLANSFALLAI